MRVKSFSYEKFYFKLRISLKLIILINSLLFFFEGNKELHQLIYYKLYNSI